MWILSSVKFLCFYGDTLPAFQAYVSFIGLTSAHVHFQIDPIYKCPIVPKTDDSCLANSGAIVVRGKKDKKRWTLKLCGLWIKRREAFWKQVQNRDAKLYANWVAKLFLRCVSFCCAGFSHSLSLFRLGAGKLEVFDFQMKTAWTSESHNWRSPCCYWSYALWSGSLLLYCRNLVLISFTLTAVAKFFIWTAGLMLLSQDFPNFQFS